MTDSVAVEDAGCVVGWCLWSVAGTDVVYYTEIEAKIDHDVVADCAAASLDSNVLLSISSCGLLRGG